LERRRRLGWKVRLGMMVFLSEKVWSACGACG
jgi:hypothetical protein